MHKLKRMVVGGSLQLRTSISTAVLAAVLSPSILAQESENTITEAAVVDQQVE